MKLALLGPGYPLQLALRMICSYGDTRKPGVKSTALVSNPGACALWASAVQREDLVEAMAFCLRRD